MKLFKLTENSLQYRLYYRLDQGFSQDLNSRPTFGVTNPLLPCKVQLQVVV